MKVTWNDASDATRLRERIGSATDARQRDRYRVVLLTGEGLGEQPELEREQIARVTGRSRQFVDKWVGRYRNGGIDALQPRRASGAPRKLKDEQERELCAMLDAGPSPDEGLAAFNGPIIRQRIQERFGVLLSPSGVYALLHRLGYNDLMPRTTHPDTDPVALEAFKKRNCPGIWLSSRNPTPTNVC